MPIYDYVLMTEPLTDAQLDGDRLDGAVRHDVTSPGSSTTTGRPPTTASCGAATTRCTTAAASIRPEYDQNPETFERLADHFFTAHPQLRGIRFTHAWGGMIDMSTKFVAFQGTAIGGKVAYSSGYTGLGVAATRFGATVMLDLLAGRDTARTTLKFATGKPLPIPPEPIAYPAITSCGARSPARTPTAAGTAC